MFPVLLLGRQIRNVLDYGCEIRWTIQLNLSYAIPSKEMTHFCIFSSHVYRFADRFTCSLPEPHEFQSSKGILSELQRNYERRFHVAASELQNQTLETSWLHRSPE